jgi:UDPglucose 6-dehydrogenase
VSFVRIAVVGAGYVGLVTGTTFAYLGHQVSLLDIDPHRVDDINAGRTPIFEAHLPGLLEDLVSRGQLTATQVPASCIPAADVIFIAVSTPPKTTGEADMAAVKAASTTVGRFLGSDHRSVVVTKSTVPIGSANAVRLWIEDGIGERSTGDAAPVFSVASNPEFLREGQAVADSFYPDRIVWGVDDAWAGEMLDELYRPLAQQSFTPPDDLPRPQGLSRVPVYQADRVSVEMIKYAANAFLATKISFANEMAAISERVGADVISVMDGIGMDSRIGRGFLNAGIGYGGSCFGKDLAALVHTAREYGYEPRLIESTRAVNDEQREAVVQKLLGALKTLKGRRIALLGLSFKPGTDDLRDAPSETIIRVLLRREARVIAYDPVAMPHARRQWADLEVRYAASAEDALSGADAAVLVTEWPEFLALDWARIGTAMARPLVLDGRNVLDADALRRAGFQYIGIGR